MTDRWIEALNVRELQAGDVTRWDYEGLSYAVFYDSGGDVFVTDNVCTHEHAFLSEGFCEGGIVECPRHFGRFDVRTGEPVGGPVFDPLRTFSAKIEGGMLLVNISPN